MGTIADKLSYLNDTKTAIKDSIVARGVSVSDSDTFRSYAIKIGEIGETVERTKFGASVDALFGDVVDGVLQKPTAPTALNFTGVTEFANGALKYKFYDTTAITSVDFGAVKKIGMFALEYAFYLNRNITNVNLSSIEIIDQSGMSYAFNGCVEITTVNLSALQTVGERGLSYAFAYCSNVETVDFSSLHTLANNALSQAFVACSKLKSVSFPSLVNVVTGSFAEYTFYPTFEYCSNLTEIHFRADMQATIEACTGYANKFGATNATIYFDL